MPSALAGRPDTYARRVPRSLPALPPTAARRVPGTGPGWAGVRLGAGVLLVLLLSGLLTATAVAGAAPVRDRPGLADGTAPEAVDGGATGAPVVLIGVTGLRWDDLGSLTTPALWDLSRAGALGTTVVRSVRSFTCPSAGWLAVGAGGRADDLPAADGSCRTLRDPLPGGAVPGWDDYVAAMAASSYDSRLGLLGDAVSDGGVRATGIGPGAGIALAGADGVPVGQHVRRPASAAELRETVRAALSDSSLVVVDAGTIRDPGHRTRDRSDVKGPDPIAGEQPDPPDLTGPVAVIEESRAEQVQAIDARIGAVVDAARRSGEDPTVLLFSVADSGRRAHLQVAAATGPMIEGTGEYAGGTIESASTRQPGFLQTTDIAPTVLAALGIRDEAPPGALVGSAARFVPDEAGAGERVAALIDEDRRAQAVSPLVSTFYVVWVALNLALYLLVTVGLNDRARGWWARLRARWWPGRATGVEHPRRVLHGLRTAAVAVAAIPVSTFLAGLVPWWRAGSAGWVLALVITGFAALITALALVPPWWRSRPLGPLGVVSVVTAVVLAVDVALGARLGLDSMMGPGSLVAGRFYGFGNPAFALFATAVILSIVALADPLLRRGRRPLAVAVVALVGLTALGVVTGIISATPTTGANFGGPPALVAGLLVLMLLTAGLRLTWRRGLLVVVVGLATSIGLAVIDWTRPADERTHLGRFIDTVLDGGLWTVLLRKGETNLRILFGSEQTLLAIGGLLLVVLLVGRPARSAIHAVDGGPYAWLSGGAPLRRLTIDAPMLLAGLGGLAVTLGVGFAVNDSGIVVPATGIGLAVPLLAAACASWMLTLHPARAHERHAALGPAPAPVAPRGSRS